MRRSHDENESNSFRCSERNATDCVTNVIDIVVRQSGVHTRAAVGRVGAPDAAAEAAGDGEDEVAQFAQEEVPVLRRCETEEQKVGAAVEEHAEVRDEADGHRGLVRERHVAREQVDGHLEVDVGRGGGDEHEHHTGHHHRHCGRQADLARPPALALALALRALHVALVDREAHAVARRQRRLLHGRRDLPEVGDQLRRVVLLRVLLRADRSRHARHLQARQERPHGAVHVVKFLPVERLRFQRTLGLLLRLKGLRACGDRERWRQFDAGQIEPNGAVAAVGAVGAVRVVARAVTAVGRPDARRDAAVAVEAHEQDARERDEEDAGDHRADGQRHPRDDRHFVERLLQLRDGWHELQKRVVRADRVERHVVEVEALVEVDDRRDAGDEAEQQLRAARALEEVARLSPLEAGAAARVERERSLERHGHAAVHAEREHHIREREPVHAETASMHLHYIFLRFS